MANRGGHAVVLGASMAGLLAARVLTEFYERVTVVERDELDDTPEPRRGVPQSRQPHALLARCGLILEELFPGIGEDLVAGGAHEWRDGDLSRFRGHFGGHLLLRTGRLPNPGGLVNYYAGRPFLEWQVRRRVLGLPAITVLDRHDLDTLISAGGEVIGARVTSRTDHTTADLFADLVVDATGRGSRTPVFLEQMGYPRPREDRLTVNVSYVSMPMRIPDGLLSEYAIFDLFRAGRPYGYAMFRCEHDTWVVGAGTLGSDAQPPASVAELMDFLERLVPADVFAALGAGEPLADVALHRFPANRWRRYDKLTKSPRGLVVVGDAVCSFNPIYGQGMTVASIEAMVLRDCLQHGGHNVHRRFHRAAARTVRIAWRTAVGSDLALPEVEGRRTYTSKVTNAYIERVLQAAESDPWVLEQFLLVTGMLEPPSRLLRPAMMRRVARHRRRSNESRFAAEVSATA
ncbi:FAD-dependent oxidoreductase [Mycolicibacterium iranicum]|uniref:2-polyprenyl-6-methoxyphenol hydroxylase-like oxidoreductase n=1 Tax=Mycolicibacterium iranicum TaxID=912594 RepID=A0A178LNB1_MYCIR|nr:hypothetical protein [Mycolicibacterium iranicum]OAN32632.1 2-polyprenyl-6-methoxyphenol hydroxylase-like oxidoreductase [Mycolicibacterium iranicum]